MDVVPTGTTDWPATIIALATIGGFVILTFLCGWAAWKADADDRKMWMDVFKTALAVMGAAMTTVVGFYFSQKSGANVAQQVVDRITPHLR